MDPLTALSTAGTVVQFVDFSIKILSSTRKIYHSVSGNLPAHEELEYVTTDISRLAARLKKPYEQEEGIEPTSPELQEICKKCDEVAQDLLQRLKHLKTDKKKNALQSLRGALLASWARKDLNELVTRLNTYKQSIRTHLLADLRQQVNAMSLAQSSRFDSLDSRIQHTIASLLDEQNTNARDIRDQTMAVAQILNRTETMISTQQAITRATVIKAMQAQEVANTVVNDPEDILETSMRTDELKLKFNVEASILESLCFSTMSTRYDEVAEAHQSTFQWLFQNSMHRAHAQPYDSFSDWLRSGDSIYWINGKAGSGKSTLMRYVFDHPVTQQELRVWAGPTRLTVAGFFFWNSGTKEQRSQLGLLRSLLFTILQQYQELIPVVFPWLWAKRYSEALDPFNHHPQEVLPLSKLMEAFSNLLKQNTVSMKLCLFIDGLDEYDGDHSTIAEFFVSIAKSPYVKVCVSSRPLLEFDDSFTSFPGLRLQDLTVGDIRNYVNDNLKVSQRYQRLSLQEPVKAPSLVEEIVSKADGVFLWVKLVVSSLLSGLGKRDDISDLQHRLRLLPTDLEKLYELMLRRIDPIHMSRASIMLQILRESQDTDENVTILAFAFANDPKSEDMVCTAKDWNESEATAYSKAMEDRLKAHSAGLLEVSGYDRYSLGSEENRAKVQYLHRTVRDYLEKPAVWNSLIANTAQSDFNPSVALIRACVLQLKTVSHLNAATRRDRQLIPLATPINRGLSCVNAALRYASMAEHHSTIDYCPILQQLRNQWHTIDRKGTTRDKFMHEVISHDLVRYANQTLGRFSSSSLLFFALQDHIIYGGDRRFIEKTRTSPEMFEALFKHGASPETSAEGVTAWQELLRLTHNFINHRDVVIKQFPIIKVFLKHGAKPGSLSLCLGTVGKNPIPRPLTAAEIIRQAFDTYIPPDGEEILNMMDRTPLKKRFKMWTSRK